MQAPEVDLDELWFHFADREPNPSPSSSPPPSFVGRSGSHGFDELGVFDIDADFENDQREFDELLAIPYSDELFDIPYSVFDDI